MKCSWTSTATKVQQRSFGISRKCQYWPLFFWSESSIITYWLWVYTQELDKLRKQQKVTRQWKKSTIGLLLIFFLLTYPVLIGGSIVCYIWFPGLLSVGVVIGYLFVLVILPVL